jgi:hypothetical protein
MEPLQGVEPCPTRSTKMPAYSPASASSLGLCTPARHKESSPKELSKQTVLPGGFEPQRPNVSVRPGRPGGSKKTALCEPIRQRPSPQSAVQQLYHLAYRRNRVNALTMAWASSLVKRKVHPRQERKIPRSSRPAITSTSTLQCSCSSP